MLMSMKCIEIDLFSSFSMHDPAAIKSHSNGDEHVASCTRIVS